MQFYLLFNLHCFYSWRLWYVNIKLNTIINCCNKSYVGNLKQMEANPDVKRLYDDLLSNYNRLIRPVVNHTETLTVWLGLKLSQLIEMNLKNQVMTTNLWVLQVSAVLFLFFFCFGIVVCLL